MTTSFLQRPCASVVAGVVLDPPGIQQKCCVRFRHLDCAVGGDGTVEAGK